jgi:hypothetical protein
VISDSSQRLREEIRSVLDTVRRMGEGSYACVLDRRRGILVQSPETEDAPREALGRFLEQHREPIFALPAAMEGSQGPAEDLFAGWEEHAFLVGVLNGRVAVVVACPDPETLRQEAATPLRALADRLLRWQPGWRIDRQGRGVFVGRPRLDLVVVGSAG